MKHYHSRKCMKQIISWKDIVYVYCSSTTRSYFNALPAWKPTYGIYSIYLGIQYFLERGNGHRKVVEWRMYILFVMLSFSLRWNFLLNSIFVWSSSSPFSTTKKNLRSSRIFTIIFNRSNIFSGKNQTKTNKQKKLELEFTSNPKSSPNTPIPNPTQPPCNYWGPLAPRPCDLPAAAPTWNSPRHRWPRWSRWSRRSPAVCRLGGRDVVQRMDSHGPSNSTPPQKKREGNKRKRHLLTGSFFGGGMSQKGMIWWFLDYYLFLHVFF